MSSCASSLMSSRTIETDDPRFGSPRVAAAQAAADAMLNPRSTDSETSSARNGNYGSINAIPGRPMGPGDYHYPEIMAGNHYPYYMPISDDIVSGSRLPGGRMS